MNSLERPDFRTLARPYLDNRAYVEHAPEDAGLELYILQALRRYWLISAIIFVVGVLLALIVYGMLGSKYEATAFVLIDSAKQTDTNAGSDSVFVNSQIELLTGQTVLRSALRNVGESKLYPDLSEGGTISEFFRRLRGAGAKISEEDRAYKFASKALKVQLEPRTSLIKVSFRHEDPHLAAAFVNALTESYLGEYRALYTQAAAANFLRTEVDSLQRKVATASSVLGAFVTANRAYSIDEQKKLLLSRQSELAKSLALVRTQLAQRQEELRTVEDQINQLRPTAARASQARDPSRPAPDPVPLPYNKSLFGDDPPLLLVKLYQEATQQYLTLKMTVAGLRAAETAHAGELDIVAKDLANLSGLESETNRLKRQLSSAEQELAEITTRAGEKRIAAAMTENNLSAIRVAQSASIPFETANQSLWLFLAVGAFLSALLAVVGSCVLQTISARRRQPLSSSRILQTVRFYLFLPM